MGEQTNCDLTCYVKKRGKPRGAYLRGKALYTGELLMCPVNSQNKEKLAQYAVSPAHGRGGLQDEVKLAPPYARSLAHARGGSQDEEKNLLLPPFTPRPYYLGYRDYIILFGIYMPFSRFQYELLVHTPNTDVYRRILECRFTHFALYVVIC